MIDRKLNADGEAKLHLEESLASGRITRSEADVIESFFAVPPSPEWPDSGLQRRMQDSGKREPVGATDLNSDSGRKPKA